MQWNETFFFTFLALPNEIDHQVNKSGLALRPQKGTEIVFSNSNTTGKVKVTTWLPTSETQTKTLHDVRNEAWLTWKQNERI